MSKLDFAERKARLHELLLGADGSEVSEALSEPLAKLGLVVVNGKFGANEMPKGSPVRVAKGPPMPLDKPDAELDKVQFLCRNFYVRESDRQVTVKVGRLGQREGSASVHFETAAGTASNKFKSKEGVIEFAPGETQKEITIDLISDPCWHATEEFSINLSEPNGVELGRNLKTVRVKIIDDDVFPSNKYCKEIMRPAPEGELPQNVGTGPGMASHWGVMVEYFKLNFRNPVTRKGSIKCLITDEIDNAIKIGRIILSLYLVDEILTKYQHEDVDENEYMVRLLVVALIGLVFTFIEHFMDFRRCFWKVAGSSFNTLQSNLLRRSLSYTPENRVLVPTSLLTQASRIGVEEVVVNGYIQIFPIIKGFGNLVFLAIFQGIKLGMAGLIPIFLFPILMSVFMKVRENVTNRIEKNRDEKSAEFLDHLTRTYDNNRLLTDFHMRDNAVTRFGKTIVANNGAFIQRAAVKTNNNYGPVWMSELLVALFIVGGGYFVVKGETNLLINEAKIGVFLATIQVFASLRAAFTAIYASFLLMVESFPALATIVTLLNLETEDPHRMKQTNEMINAGEEAWQTAQKCEFSPEFNDYLKERSITRALDKIPLKVQGAMFQYRGSEKALKFDAEFLQGELVGVATRGQGVGKGTFLKLLAGVLQPSQGSVFVPAHLRLIHVTADPLFFNRRNLLQNICLGLPESEHEAALGRVREILTRLGFKEDVLRRLQADGGHAIWGEILSHQQCQLLNLARALMPSPEVIVAHTPLLPFDNSTRLNMLQVLREFVDCRGFEEDQQRFYTRHPRTCIFSFLLSTQNETELLDRVLTMHGDGSFVSSSPKDVADSL